MMEIGWIPIGRGTEESLARAVDALAKKWPGRYDYAIKDAPSDTAPELPCRLSVRHRDCPSDEEIAAK